MHLSASEFSIVLKQNFSETVKMNVVKAVAFLLTLMLTFLSIDGRDLEIGVPLGELNFYFEEKKVQI